MTQPQPTTPAPTDTTTPTPNGASASVGVVTHAPAPPTNLPKTGPESGVMLAGAAVLAVGLFVLVMWIVIRRRARRSPYSR